MLTRQDRHLQLIAVTLCIFGLAAFARPARSASRPVSDFVTAQGTSSYFIPPVPDLIGWLNQLSDPTQRFAWVDYAGAAARWLQINGGPNLGTQITGTVNERALSDGRAEVIVNLDMANALSWAINFNPTGPGDQYVTSPPIFGYRPQELLANPGARPGLSNGRLQVKLINTAPGAPLPDLVTTFVLGNAAPGQELVSMSFHANGSGPLHAAFGVPEGTPGSLLVIQTGLFMTSFKGATGDAFPAERVDVR